VAQRGKGREGVKKNWKTERGESNLVQHGRDRSALNRIRRFEDSSGVFWCLSCATSRRRARRGRGAVAAFYVRAQGRHYLCAHYMLFHLLLHLFLYIIWFMSVPLLGNCHLIMGTMGMAAVWAEEGGGGRRQAGRVAGLEPGGRRRTERTTEALAGMNQAPSDVWTWR